MDKKKKATKPNKRPSAAKQKQANLQDHEDGFAINLSSKNGKNHNRSWAVFTLPVIIVLIIVGRLVFDYQNFASELGVLFSVLRFLIWGFAIFFLLSPFVKWFQKLFKKLKFGAKLLAMVIVYLLFFGMLAVVFVWFLPLVINNVLVITQLIPDWAVAIGELLEQAQVFIGTLNIVGLEQQIETTLTGIIDTVAKGVGNISLYILDTSYNIVRGALDFVIGIVISVYMIIEQDALRRRIKKVTYSVFSKQKADRASDVSKKSGEIFRKFIIGKTIDSAIVGVVSYFVLLLIGAPVPMLLAVIMAITNMIPSVGPIIGAVPCLLITLILSPEVTLWVLGYIIVVQMVDGWVLGPKILGESVGLEPFYIIVAVFIGGGLFGVLGAFLGTPAMAVIKYLLQGYTDKKLKEKDIVIS